jgi:hypothetical protein
MSAGAVAARLLSPARRVSYGDAGAQTGRTKVKMNRVPSSPAQNAATLQVRLGAREPHWRVQSAVMSNSPPTGSGALRGPTPCTSEA